MNITSIEVTYCTGYNGVSMCVNDDLSEDEVEGEQGKHLQSIRDTIVDTLYDDCDEDGEFMGSKTRAEKLITKLVKEHFPDVALTVAFDEVSS